MVLTWDSVMDHLGSSYKQSIDRPSVKNRHLVFAEAASVILKALSERNFVIRCVGNVTCFSEGPGIFSAGQCSA